MSLIFDNLKALESSQEDDLQPPRPQRGPVEPALSPQRPLLPWLAGGVVVVVLFGAGRVLFSGGVDESPVAMDAGSEQGGSVVATSSPPPAAAGGTAMQQGAAVSDGAAAQESPASLSVQWPEQPASPSTPQALDLAGAAQDAQPQAEADVEPLPLPAAEDRPPVQPAVADAGSPAGAGQAPVEPAIEWLELQPVAVTTSVEVRQATSEAPQQPAQASTPAPIEARVTVVAPPRQSVEALRSQLLLALEAGRHEQAGDALQQLQQQLGRESDFFRRMEAYYLLRSEQFDAAESAYDAILVRSPDDGEARLNSGWLAMQRGDLNKARNRLRPLMTDSRYRAQVTPLMAEIDRAARLGIQ